MKRFLTWTIEMSAIAVIMFILAHLFVDGLVREMEIKEEHNRIHWRSR